MLPISVWIPQEADVKADLERQDLLGGAPVNNKGTGARNRQQELSECDAV